MASETRFGRKIRMPSTVQIKHDISVLCLADAEKQESAGRTADEYRSRADALSKSMAGRNARERAPMERKQKALNDMADNQEWLDGHPGCVVTPRSPT